MLKNKYGLLQTIEQECSVACLGRHLVKEIDANDPSEESDNLDAMIIIEKSLADGFASYNPFFFSESAESMFPPIVLGTRSFFESSVTCRNAKLPREDMMHAKKIHYTY